MPFISVFDVLGPNMIGPSSSHTAGAARIGRVAHSLLGEKPVEVLRLLSSQVDFPEQKYLFTSFNGAWAREFEAVRTECGPGTIVGGSRTGCSSNRANPFVMLESRGTDEVHGECYGFHLLYSGDHFECACGNAYGKLRFLHGIQPEGFSWRLEPGEGFCAPEAAMTYGWGAAEMSGNLHAFIREHVVRGWWKRRARPVLVNSWESFYFRFTQKDLLRLARRGKALGAELFRVERYVELVLSYLRLGGTSTDYVIRQVDVDNVLRQAARKYAPLFIRGKVSLELNETGLRALSDEKWLQLVIEQVLSNAVKYAPGGHVKVWSEGERLFIQDDGVGIAAEDLPRIFERGFTGYNGRMDKRATGIGLYLSQEICRKLGHTITVESELGKGTRVTVGLARPYLEVE